MAELALTPPLLINSLTGVQAQTHEEARHLWEAASVYYRSLRAPDGDNTKFQRIHQVITCAARAHGNHKLGKSVDEVAAMFTGILEDEKARLRLGDMTGRNPESMEEFAKRMNEMWR